MRRCLQGFVVAVFGFLGFCIGKWFCAPPPVRLDISFVPGTGTDTNPWGHVRQVETYYMKGGRRILHGQRLLFKHEGGSSVAEMFEHGKSVQMSQGPTYYWPIHYEQVAGETFPADNRRSAPRQPPEGPPPAKPGTAPQSPRPDPPR